MNQIPDHAAERVLGTIHEVINSADAELEQAEQWMKGLVDEFPRPRSCTAIRPGCYRARASTVRPSSTAALR